MPFEIYEKRKHTTQGLPKGICALHWSGEKLLRVNISATDSMNGLRDTEFVQALYDADTNTIGLAKSDVGLKLCRQKATSMRTVTLPAKLASVLAKREAKSGRYYFCDNPKEGFYTIDLNVPVPETAK